MEENIKNYLEDIEREKGIRILLACETGSRAWGFPSPDSDYDVRMIYKHDTNWYLSLTEEKDTIELMLDDNEIDISGWDVRKSLRLLLKSNAALLERIQSPIIYSADADFLHDINVLAKSTYSRITTIHHYLSMAKKCYADIRDEPMYKLKRFFYGLRASVACLWILEKEEIPPIEFQKMLDGLVIDKSLTDRMAELIGLKATISESYLHTGEKELIEFMADCIHRAEQEAKTLPASKGQMHELNSFFKNTVTNE